MALLYMSFKPTFNLENSYRTLNDPVKNTAQCHNIHYILTTGKGYLVQPNLYPVTIVMKPGSVDHQWYAMF
jgi:hypothetical protein